MGVRLFVERVMNDDDDDRHIIVGDRRRIAKTYNVRWPGDKEFHGGNVSSSKKTQKASFH